MKKKIVELLELMYNNGKVPFPYLLLGPNEESSEWRVNMLTGPIPDIGNWMFNHRKQFTGTIGSKIKVRGLNFIFKDFYFGGFFVKTTPEALVLDYNINCNGRITKPIVDYLRTTKNPDILIGKFTYNGIFRGYFTLTRIK